MSDSDTDQEEQKPTGVFSTLMADGNWLFVKGKYSKAADSYTEALAMKPDDKNCFVGRSRCYLRMGLPQNALKDAEAALKEDESFPQGLYQKAEALYYMGDLEFALLYYHKGQRLCPQIQDFRLGIQKVQEAIEISVRGPSPGDTEANAARAPPQTEPLTPVKKQPTQSKMTAKQMLGEFYSDKKYLENVVKSEGVIKCETKSGGRLQGLIQSCLTRLHTCSQFWTHEKPVYDRHLKHRRRNRYHSLCEQFLIKSLEDIDAALASGNAKGSLKKAEHVMKMVKGWSEKDMPNKREVLGSLHSCIGNALFDLGEMDKAIVHHQKDLELAEQCKLSEARCRALNNIGRVFARIGEFTQAIEFWEMNIPLVRDGLEKTWLFHEIGRCYLELDRHEKARDYGTRSLEAADDIDDVKWQTNANVLLAQSELKLGNLEPCISHFEKALIHAKLQENDLLIAAIQKALDEAKLRLSE